VPLFFPLAIKLDRTYSIDSQACYPAVTGTVSFQISSRKTSVWNDTYSYLSGLFAIKFKMFVSFSVKRLQFTSFKCKFYIGFLCMTRGRIIFSMLSNL
jgi:hypothetical protein